MVFNNKTVYKKDKGLVLENVKQAKQYLQQGTLSQEDFENLVRSINPKYIGWAAKIWIDEKPDFDDLRNTVEEYDTFLKKGKAKTKDIYQFKSFKDLKAEIDDLNKTGSGLSLKDLESDYELIRDDQDLLIKVPHTHEASRKLGLTDFAFRDCGDDKKDSAWCTTYKAPDHFNDYYYRRTVTFYYIKVRSKELIQALKEAFKTNWRSYVVTALVVDEDGGIDGYTGLDKQMKSEDIQKYTKILGLT